MSDGRLKADRDFTKEVDKAIPEAQDLAKVARSRVRTTNSLANLIAEQRPRCYREAPHP
jgi:hypothetical protein